jgi:hypothetical protein
MNNPRATQTAAGIIRVSRILLAPLFAVTLIAGCDGSPDGPPKNTHTVEDFCNPWLDFFKTDLQFGDVQLNIEGDPKMAIDDVKIDAGCRFTPGPSQLGPSSPLRGHAMIAPIRDETPPIESSEYRNQKGITSLPGYSVDIWVHDERIIGSKDRYEVPNTMGAVKITTIVGQRFGTLEVTNGNDSLAVTDEQIGHAAELLIRLTREMGA